MRIELTGNDTQFLDEVFATAPKGAEIVLGPGSYHTRGPWAFEGQGFCQLKAGQSLVGAGRRKTTIRLVGAERSTPGAPDRLDVNGLWAGSYKETARFGRIGGFTLDVLGSHPAGGSVGGLTVHGSAHVFDVEVVGPHGNQAAGLEAFGIRMTAPDASGEWDGHGGSIVENALVRVFDRNSYVTACLVEYAHKGVMPPRRSLVSDVEAVAPGGCHAAFTGSNVTFENVRARGFTYGFNHDTGPLEGVEIRDAWFQDVGYCGVYIVAVDKVDGFHVEGSKFAFTPSESTPRIVLALIKGQTSQTPRNVSFNASQVQNVEAPLVLFSTDIAALGLEVPRFDGCPGVELCYVNAPFSSWPWINGKSAKGILMKYVAREAVPA